MVGQQNQLKSIKHFPADPGDLPANIDIRDLVVIDIKDRGLSTDNFSKFGQLNHRGAEGEKTPKFLCLWGLAGKLLLLLRRLGIPIDHNLGLAFMAISKSVVETEDRILGADVIELPDGEGGDPDAAINADLS